MKWFRRTGALVIAIQVVACGGGASDDGTRPETRKDAPGPNEVIQILGDDASRTPTPARDVRDVIINDVRLSDAEILEIEQRYKVQIVNANYWYDSMNGAWGLKGGPTRGFVLAGLQLGGPLKADASGGAPTGTFVNGRELHPLDISGLRRCVNVERGRFWVGPDGTGGLEGGPATFNLYALCGGGSGGGARGWVCDGGSCGTARTVTGASGVGLEGGGQAGVYSSEGLILTPN
jgi:hypothetical protein